MIRGKEYILVSRNNRIYFSIDLLKKLNLELGDTVAFGKLTDNSFVLAAKKASFDFQNLKLMFKPLQAKSNSKNRQLFYNSKEIADGLRKLFQRPPIIGVYQNTFKIYLGPTIVSDGKGQSISNIYM